MTDKRTPEFDRAVGRPWETPPLSRSATAALSGPATRPTPPGSQHPAGRVSREPKTNPASSPYQPPGPPSRRWRPAIAALGLTLLAALPSVAQANQWRDSLAACAQGIGNTDDLAQTGTAFAGCMTDSAAHVGLGFAADRLNAVGKERIGPGFAVVSRLSPSLRSDEKVLGDIDLVLPLGSTETHGDANPARALFLQSGITRWTDTRGEVRHDTRLGGAHRFTVNGDKGGVFGISALLQENREYGHRRMVAGLDYAGAWGNGGLSWYRPLTAWLPGRSGYEERALGGLDLALNLDLTTTVDLRATLGRWERTTDPDEVHTQASLGLDWRPHDYLTLSANLHDTGSDTGGNAAWRVRLEIPLGRHPQTKPRWHGFGSASGGSAQGADIWRGMTHTTRIQYAERTVRTAPSGQVINGVTVRFLQAEAESGTDIRVEVSLPAPAGVDTPLTLHLRPGDDGGPPAEPGVDFVDEPVAVTIRAGDSSAIAVIRLLNNSLLTGPRSLGVTVRAG